MQFRTHKVIYRRYAGLFFSMCVDITDNELAYLECIHLFVEILDHFFSNVCELDLVFNFHKVTAISQQAIPVSVWQLWYSWSNCTPFSCLSRSEILLANAFLTYFSLHWKSLNMMQNRALYTTLLYYAVRVRAVNFFWRSFSSFFFSFDREPSFMGWVIIQLRTVAWYSWKHNITGLIWAKLLCFLLVISDIKLIVFSCISLDTWVNEISVAVMQRILYFKVSAIVIHW